MRSGTRMLIAVLVLGVVLTRPATGQRLVSDFPRVAEVAVPRIGPLRVGGPPGICASPVVRTLLGAAGGAVAGYLAYRLIISPFTSDESATHRLRTEERRVGKEGRSRWSPYH